MIEKDIRTLKTGIKVDIINKENRMVTFKIEKDKLVIEPKSGENNYQVLQQHYGYFRLKTERVKELRDYLYWVQTNGYGIEFDKQNYILSDFRYSNNVVEIYLEWVPRIYY
jgi:hypothetical protein